MSCASSCLTVTASRVGGIAGSASRVDALKVSASLICRLADYYLRVDPDTVWVSEEIIEQLLIESNTNWKIS